MRRALPLFAILFAACATARTQSLARRIDTIRHRPQVAGAIWGIDVVDDSGRTIYARNETTLLIPANVKISKDQKSLKLEDLKEGEQVTVRTEKRDGHLVAAEIQTGGAASAAMPQQPPPPGNPRIEKIRQVLKVADWILQQMQEQKEEAPR